MFHCIDAGALLDLGRAAAHGAAKYSLEGWREVPDGERRYWDAAMRHLLGHRLDPIDADSGLPHLALAAWNCLAALARGRPFTASSPRQRRH